MHRVQYTLACIFLLLYAGIGAYISVDYPFDNFAIQLICAFLFVVLPGLGAIGLWYRYRVLIAICAVFFLTQSVRYVGPDALLPHIAPITISFPFGSFAGGKGYLIDILAILLAAGLAWLARKPHVI